MKYVIIAFCVALILFAIYTLVKNITSQTKGRCTGCCKGCSKSGSCGINNKNK